MGHGGLIGSADRKKRYRDKHRRNNLCFDCSKKAEINKVRCKYHLEYVAEKVRQLRIKKETLLI